MAQSLAHRSRRGFVAYRRRRAQARCHWLLVGSALVAFGCGGTEPTPKHSPQPLDVPPAPTEGGGCSDSLPLNACQEGQSGQSLVVDVRSAAGTNDGGVIHVLVRKTTAVDFEKEDYAAIVDTLSATDSSTVCWRKMLPGSQQVFAITRPTEGSAVGIYFLFTHPGSSWKQLVEGSRRCAVFELSGNEASDRSSPMALSSDQERPSGCGGGQGRLQSIAPAPAEGE